MPELPEVESLRIGLQKVLLSQKIISVKVRNPKLISQKKSHFSLFEWEACQMKNQEIFENQLVGQKFAKISRRAKNLILELASGDLILTHLKMTGQLVFVGKNDNHLVYSSTQNIDKNYPESEPENNLQKNTLQKNQTTNLEEKNVAKEQDIVFGGHPIEVLDLPSKHTHIIFELTDGWLFYNDIRQFGYMRYYPAGSLDQETHFAKLGVEPLSKDFQLDDFTKKLQKLKSGVLKKVLLDQKIVVGLGNIYCDEVCFASGILPTRTVNTLTDLEIRKLFTEIKRIIPLAVKHGGSSIANYLLADGKRGNYADFHLVYAKYNQPCVVCGNILSKTKIGGRTTTFCHICQR